MADMREQLLTERERAILQALAKGRSVREIAAELEISVSSVRAFKDRIIQKVLADAAGGRPPGG